MTLDPKFTAAVALHRFGLGPRRGLIAAIASDPRGALLAELERPDIARIDGIQLMASAPAARAAFEFREEQRSRQIVAQREDERRRAMASAAGTDPNASAMAPADAAANPANKPAKPPP